MAARTKPKPVLTRQRLARIITRAMRDLPACAMPRPDILDDPRELTAPQRRVHVGKFRYVGVVVAPMCEWVYVWRARLERDFGDDDEAMEEALRAVFRDEVAPGFRPVVSAATPARSRRAAGPAPRPRRRR